MSRHFVLGASFFVPRSWFLVSAPVALLAGLLIFEASAANEAPRTKNKEQGTDEVFRPEAGKFPPLEKAHTYRGELVFVDQPRFSLFDQRRQRRQMFVLRDGRGGDAQLLPF